MTQQSPRHRLPATALCALASLGITLSVSLSAVAEPGNEAPPGRLGQVDSEGRVGFPAQSVPGVYIVGFAAPAAIQRVSVPATHSAGLRQALQAGSFEGERVLVEIDREHTAFLQAASAALGRTVEPLAEPYRYRRAFNGMALRLSDAEARTLRARADVRMVTPMQLQPLHTDTGPGHIGAHQTWAGYYRQVGHRIFDTALASPVPGPHNRGEGVVVGVVDTGLNFASPSFSSLDAARYRHSNPLGTGNYLGLCGDAAVPEWTGRCNDKVIGAWDFVSALMPEIIEWDPDALSGPGAEDIHGHGSHTAATAVGGPVLAQVPGASTRLISGVAPRANLVVYKACYVAGDGRGLCPDAATLASIEQSIADGVVDVVNYSIGGGTSPWQEPVSLAFLEAARAGIITAASAGNSGPGAGSVSHLQPWTMTVAAASHSRGAFVNLLRVEGSLPVPPELQALPLSFPPSSVPLSGPIHGELAYDPGNPLLCDPPEPGSAAGEVMMIRRGTCTFVAKIQNAQTAGASAVLLVNTDNAALNPNLDGTTIPVAVLPRSAGDQVAEYHLAADGAAVTLTYPAVPSEVVPDRLANFSSRGPAPLSLLKPDITGPGVNILAALAGEARAYGLMSGTSMSAPHLAGAAALLRGRHPDWSPAQIKSALMLSARADVIDAVDGLPATPHEQGAGRVRVDAAARVPLVLDIDPDDYLASDPDQGGQPHALNLPSFAADRCVGSCSFSRSLSRVGAQPSFWALSLADLPGRVSPVLRFSGGDNATLDLQVDVDGLEQGRYHHGTVRLRSSTRPSGRVSLDMPVSVYVDPFALSLSDQVLEATVEAGGATSVTLGVANSGNDGLSWSLLQGMQEIPVVNQPANTLNGVVSSLYTDVNAGSFVADDLDILETTRFRSLSVDGFLFAYYLDTVDMYAQSLTWSIYADADGVPAGSPVGGEAPVWTHTAAVDGPGVTPASNTLHLDLDAAGIELELAPGRYWLVAYPSFESHTPQGVTVMWFRFLRNVQDGAMAVQVNTDPEFGGQPDAEWAPLSDAWAGHSGADMVMTADAQCTPDWVEVSKTGGSVGAGAETPLTLQISAADLEPGTHHGRLCLESNDPQAPLSVIPIILNVGSGADRPAPGRPGPGLRQR